MRVVLRRTVVGDIDRRFDNLSGSHHQSHVNCVSSVYGIYVSGQLSREVQTTQTTETPGFKPFTVCSVVLPRSSTSLASFESFVIILNVV